MDVSGRAVAMARLAVALAAGAPVSLPDSLLLWRLAGERPVVAPRRSDDPGGDLGEALERSLGDDERRRGAHYTPAVVADRVAALAVERPGTVVDPACGGGAILLAAGRRLVDLGVPRSEVARELLWGADLDPLAAAVTEAAITLWAGTAPAPGHVVPGDTLHDGIAVWASPTRFDIVIGNPPFQGQLARATQRPAADTARLAERFGHAVSAYVDTAALFLLVGVELCRVGGRVALIQPQSTVASRDAGSVRAALAPRAQLVDLWAPVERLFAAKVHVCVPVLEVGGSDQASGPAAPTREQDEVDRTWAGRLAGARGVPLVELASPQTVGDIATVVAGFRDEYYGLVPHVREASVAAEAPLVTSGLIGIGSSAWGDRPVRFAKQAWARPEVDLSALRRHDPRISGWVERIRRPKALVASQTRVVEAAADVTGTWVPSTPVVSVLPHDAQAVHRLTALLCSPPVSAWAARRAAGTGLSADSIRVSARLVADVPLPTDERAWAVASAALGERDLEAFAEAATAMFDLTTRQHKPIVDWWNGRVKLTWPPGERFR